MKILTIQCDGLIFHFSEAALVALQARLARKAV
jgi:hypothetical protein